MLVNTRSLNGVEWLQKAKDKLTEHGLRVSSAEGFSKAPELFARAKEEAQGDKLIIVGGGDGTMSAVAGILAHGPATMGVLPLGTGNAFARDLNIPTDLEKAVDVLVTGMSTEVDLGLCNGKHFVNVVTIGITATVAQTLTVPLKRRFGRFVYAIALTRGLKRMKPFLATIATENGTKELSAVQIVIGSGRYHAGPLPLSPLAAITSGSLRLYAVEAGSKFEFLKYALLLPTGFQGLLKTVHSEDTAGGTITTVPTKPTVADGEMGGKTPIRFSVDPLALKVMVPESFKG